MTKESAAALKAARDVGDYDWGTSVSEQYHYKRIAAMERLRAALSAVEPRWMGPAEYAARAEAGDLPAEGTYYTGETRPADQRREAMERVCEAARIVASSTWGDVEDEVVTSDVQELFAALDAVDALAALEKEKDARITNT